MTTQILILEDEMIVSLDIQTALELQGYSVIGACATADDAVALAQISKIDLIIADFSLRGQLNGEEAVSAIRSHLGKAIPVIFVSGTGDQEIINRLGIEPCTFLKKPIKTEDLLDCIRTLIHPVA